MLTLSHTPAPCVCLSVCPTFCTHARMYARAEKCLPHGLPYGRARITYPPRLESAHPTWRGRAMESPDIEIRYLLSYLAPAPSSFSSSDQPNPRALTDHFCCILSHERFSPLQDQVWRSQLILMEIGNNLETFFFERDNI